jgi:hypothetical protein
MKTRFTKLTHSDLKFDISQLSIEKTVGGKVMIFEIIYFPRTNKIINPDQVASLVGLAHADAKAFQDFFGDLSDSERESMLTADGCVPGNFSVAALDSGDPNNNNRVATFEREKGFWNRWRNVNYAGKAILLINKKLP